MHLFIPLLEYFQSHLEPPSAFRCSTRDIRIPMYVYIYIFRRDTRARMPRRRNYSSTVFTPVSPVGLITSLAANLTSSSWFLYPSSSFFLENRGLAYKKEKGKEKDKFTRSVNLIPSKLSTYAIMGREGKRREKRSVKEDEFFSTRKFLSFSQRGSFFTEREKESYSSPIYETSIVLSVSL